jgi:NAD(P)H-flavin reductase
LIGGMPQTAELNWLLIDRVHPETHDVTTIVAVPAREKRTLAFAPGQFCMLAAPGAGEIPISISGDPSRPDRLTFTIRATGVSSSTLASRRPGDAISMRGPVGNGWPLEAAFGNDVLLIAGGMGLAALRPIVYTILQNRAKFGRLSILCGARTAADLIYKPELADWDRLKETSVLTTVDAPTRGWNGNLGVVTELVDTIALRPANTTAMLCGPEPMMFATARNLGRRGLARDQVFLSTLSGIAPLAAAA